MNIKNEYLVIFLLFLVILISGCISDLNSTTTSTSTTTTSTTTVSTELTGTEFIPCQTDVDCPEEFSCGEGSCWPPE